MTDGKERDAARSELGDDRCDGVRRVVAAVTLPGVERSVACARRLVAEALGADHPCGDDLRTCISEAFTNSVLHSSSRNGGKVTLTLVAEESAVVVEVTDDGAAEKRPHLADDPTGIHGRGMRIIDMLAADWGVNTEPGRTTVWMRFPATASTANAWAAAHPAELVGVPREW